MSGLWPLIGQRAGLQRILAQQIDAVSVCQAYCCKHHLVAMLLQALCFLAGANSIFDGDKLLTTKNNERNADLEMFEELGLRSRPAFVPYPAGAPSSDGSAVHRPDTAEHLASANQLATATAMASVQQQATVA